MLDFSDYKILNNVVDYERGVGDSKLRGTTVYEISETTGLSVAKIRRAMKKLLEKGFVDFSAKRGRAETFHITKAGLEEIESVGQSVLEDKE